MKYILKSLAISIPLISTLLITTVTHQPLELIAIMAFMSIALCFVVGIFVDLQDTK